MLTKYKSTKEFPVFLARKTKYYTEIDLAHAQVFHEASINTVQRLFYILFLKLFHSAVKALDGEVLIVKLATISSVSSV